jgi:hypothetical protein
LLEDFKSGPKSFAISDFKSSYTEEEWQRLNNHLRMMGINQARVFLSVSLTPETIKRSIKSRPVENIPVSLIQ